MVVEGELRIVVLLADLGGRLEVSARAVELAQAPADHVVALVELREEPIGLLDLISSSGELLTGFQ